MTRLCIRNERQTDSNLEILWLHQKVIRRSNEDMSHHPGPIKTMLDHHLPHSSPRLRHIYVLPHPLNQTHCSFSRIKQLRSCRILHKRPFSRVGSQRFPKKKSKTNPLIIKQSTTQNKSKSCLDEMVLTPFRWKSCSKRCARVAPLEPWQATYADMLRLGWWKPKELKKMEDAQRFGRQSSQCLL